MARVGRFAPYIHQLSSGRKLHYTRIAITVEKIVSEN